MFNDEQLPFIFDKMHEFSTADGFVEITESLAEMIKYLANEPSVGLFYIQQHIQNSVPNLVNLRVNAYEKSREMSLHTEDLEDSITMVRSMKDSGFPIADEMINDIKKSLAIISTKQPTRGLISSQRLGFQTGRTSSWNPSNWSCSAVPMQQDGERTGNYLSSVLKSAKERASNFKWPQLDSKELRQSSAEKLMPYLSPPLPAAATSITSTVPDAEAEELPLLNQIADEPQEEESPVDESLPPLKLHSLSENYDEFKADREAKLEEWLGGTNSQLHGRGTDAEQSSAI